MCVTCGCSEPGAVVLTDAASGRQTTTAPAPGGWHTHTDGTTHSHGHDHGHAHAEPHAPVASPAPGQATGRADPATQHAQLHGRTIRLEQDLLAKNQLLAERNRGWFGGRDVLALNLVSSPGSGKTSLLERTIRDLQGTMTISVIEGDQATLNDAQRIRAAGASAVQINTGTGCHLDADMVARGLSQLQPQAGSVVMIENVGNLVCPALFDLGEHAKVLVLSVTEGEDKPIKYPHMFRAAALMLLNKIDLLPHLAFDVERCVAYARQVNPDIEVLQVSAQSGAGMQQWYRWIAQRRTPAALAVTEST
jgi:hydrogenase nickel incorporation protein HypB